MSLRKAIGCTVILESNGLGLGVVQWSCLPSMYEALGFIGLRRLGDGKERGEGGREGAEEELLKQHDPLFV